MFPNGNIVFERSKFNENVPGWELLPGRMGANTESSRSGTARAGCWLQGFEKTGLAQSALGRPPRGTRASMRFATRPADGSAAQPAPGGDHDLDEPKPREAPDGRKGAYGAIHKTR
jgi:hypothetical protein